MYSLTDWFLEDRAENDSESKYCSACDELKVDCMCDIDLDLEHIDEPFELIAREIVAGRLTSVQDLDSISDEGDDL